MPSSFSPAASTHGFTAVPRALFERLLVLDLTKREIIVLLLIVRLTYGVRHASWVSLRQADLAAVGISASHAKATLEALVKKGLVTFDEERKAYQVARGFIRGANSREEGETTRAAHLARLVAQQLVSISRSSVLGVPKTGSLILPKREQTTSQNGNIPAVVAEQFSRSRQGFVRAVELPKDKERHI